MLEFTRIEIPKIKSKKGIRVRDSSGILLNVFVQNVQEIQQKARPEKNDGVTKTFLSGERPKRDFLHCFKQAIFSLRKITKYFFCF